MLQQLYSLKEAPSFFIIAGDTHLWKFYSSRHLRDPNVWLLKTHEVP